MTEPSRIFREGLLEGRVALVTGGGTGLGKATAAELVACGAQVVIAGRRAGVLDEAAAQIGDGCTTAPGDVRTTEGARALVQAVLDRHGRLDVLVNNAGGQYFAPAEAIEPKGWGAVLNLNLGGTYEMSRAAAELAMRPAGGGMMINITHSPHGGLAGMAHSSSARAGIEELSREQAEEWRDDGIAVVAIAVGHFKTEALKKYPPSVTRSVENSVPIGRLGHVEEHAWLVALLASPLGRAFNGSTVTNDGARDNWFGKWPPPDLGEAEDEVPIEQRRRQQT